jgi:hypothetical protein
MTAVWKAVGLLTNRKMVLLKLADHADDEGGSCWPSVGRIAHECGLSERTVQTILAEFRGEQIIVVEGNAAGGSGRSRLYRINVERAQELHPLEPYRAGKGCNSYAPFDDEKGATESAKGCSSFAPKPSVTIKQNRQGERARARRTRIAPDWQPDIETTIWAQQRGFTDDEIGRERARFEDSARAHGRLYVDWQAAFRNWLNKTPEFAAQRGGSHSGNRRGSSGFIGEIARAVEGDQS